MKMKLLKKSMMLGFFTLFLAATLPLVNAQCSPGAGCKDCFTWCSSHTGFCTNPTVKGFCRKSCNLCPESNPVCDALDCAHRCVLSADANSATCACFDGYQLDADGRTCNDIDECALDSDLCTGSFCNNTLGGYICTSCTTYNNDRIWSYYERDECCLRDGTSQCGKSSTNLGRIVNGTDSKEKRWPWTAYIRILFEEICGGSLITDRHIVTAAHCFDGGIQAHQVTAILGLVNKADDGNVHVQTFNVSQIIKHPDYTVLPNHDVAILVLERPVFESIYVRPVCLPGGHRPAEGEVCWATGYGTTSFRGVPASTLQEVDLPIVNTSICQEAFRGEEYQVNKDYHICAGYAEGGKDACQGDSGGPLVCQRCNSCDWYLAGVTSFGVGCATPGFYGVYTNILHYEQWITRTTSLPFSQGECKKPVWDNWSEFGSCSSTCGVGTRTRSRMCLNGSPGIPSCLGDVVETDTCNGPPCEGGSWSSWTTGRCSETCGRGVRTKTRTCLNGVIGDAGCPAGRDTMTEICIVQRCPEWGPYGKWSVCSLSCGGGVRSASRECLYGEIGQAGCIGSATKEENCNTDICPGKWTDWSNDGECTVTCGTGDQPQRRECVGGTDPGGPGCEGSRTRVIPCELSPCPEWGVWSSFGVCSRTCGGGSQSRTRTCMGGAVGTGNCIGESTQSRDCGTQTCSTTGGVCDAQINSPALGDAQCCQYASFDFCITYAPYMLLNCAKACCEKNNNLVPCASRVSICQDTTAPATCAYYKSLNLCPSLETYCARTCNFCS